MVSYYLLIVRDHHCGGRVVRASEIFEDRAKNKFWGLKRRSAYLKRIRKGDKVIFYIGGRYGGKIVGCGIVNSAPQLISDAVRKEALCLHSEDYTHLLTFSEVKVWPEPIPFKDICSQLAFVANKDKPHVYLQGAVRKLSEEDYRILSSARNRIYRVSNPT